MVEVFVPLFFIHHIENNFLLILLFTSCITNLLIFGFEKHLNFRGLKGVTLLLISKVEKVDETKVLRQISYNHDFLFLRIV